MQSSIKRKKNKQTKIQFLKVNLIKYTAFKANKFKYANVEHREKHQPTKYQIKEKRKRRET